MAEIVQGLVGETTQQAITSRGERAAMQPKVAMTEDEAEATEILEGRADLTFTLEYEVLPTYELADFKGLKIERPVVDVTDEEVEERLKQIAESARTYTPVERPAAQGDRVSFEYSASTDGEVFESNSTAIVLGSGQFIPGFEDALVGVKGGEKKTIELTFPEDYPAENLKGKPATFDVSVSEVAEPGEIVLDDASCQRGSGLNSIDKLRETVRKQIESEYGQATRQHVKRQLLDQLDAKHSFPLPENLVEQEFENIWRQVMHDVEHHGKSFEAEGTTEEERAQGISRHRRAARAARARAFEDRRDGGGHRHRRGAAGRALRAGAALPRPGAPGASNTTARTRTRCRRCARRSSRRRSSTTCSNSPRSPTRR